MVNGITFAEQLITSANFSHFVHTFLNKANGVTKGCEVSHANNNVYVQKGYFIEFGRMVQIIGTEEIETPEVLSGQLYCKVVFEIDLTKTNTAEDFQQGYFRTLTGTEAYPELTQQDLDNDGTLYQMPWCQYIKQVDGISEFRDLREILNLDAIWSAVSNQNTQYKTEFDEYFAAQRTEIERLIAELEGQGYLTMATARQVTLITLAASGWSDTAPYTQTVSVEGILAADTPVGSLYIPPAATAANEKALKKAAGCVSYFDTADGAVTVTCIGKKPAVDFQMQLKGV